MDLSIIIVNYNTKDLLHDCLVSISETVKDLAYEIIVVDNNSTDGSTDMVRHMFPSTQLVCNNVNLGFSRANNQGYSHSRGEYLLFLNSDTLVLEGAIFGMFDYLRTHTEVGIVGPKILDSARLPTRSYMRFLDLKKLFMGSKRLRLFFDVEKNRIHFPRYDYNSTRQTEWLSGACLMTKRKVFVEAGLFDEHFFLYLEDMDFCLQVRKLGCSVTYLPSAEIVHLFGGSSTGNDKKMRRIKKDSTIYYFKKNFPIVHYLAAKMYLTLLPPSF
jgi:GT2 family glycosyltransferase